MLKKLFGGIFTITLLLLITTLSLLLIVRTITTKETINNMLNIFATSNNETIITEDIKVEENIDETTIVDTILNDVLADTSIPSEVIDYIESEEVNEYINQYITQYFEYTIGMSEMPTLNTPEFNEIVDTAIGKYEQSTGNDIAEEEITTIITTIDQTVSEVEIPSNKYLDAFKQVLRVCFDNRTLYLLIAVIVVNIIIVGLLVGFRVMFKRLSVILIIDSIILFAGALLLTFLGQNELVNSVIKIIIKNINTFAYATFTTGVVLFIIMIFIKPKKKITESEGPVIVETEEPKKKEIKKTSKKSKEDEKK